MIKQNYEMEVFVHGKHIKEYIHQNKTYVEGRKNSTFSIKLRNNSSEKALFVLTIDGLSVIDGKDASFDSRGYIINGYDSMIVNGWRVNDNEVAQFFFSSPDESYRKRMSKGNNLGVIGLAVFTEKEKYQPTIIKEYIPYYPAYPRYPNYPYTPVYPYWGTTSYTATGANTTNNTDCSYYASQENQNLGTGWGKKESSKVVSTNFDRKEKPNTIFEIFYNTREQLEKIGINFTRRQVAISTPRAFPREQTEYCEQPNN